MELMDPRGRVPVGWALALNALAGWMQPLALALALR